jgi:hypothetical protein
MIDFIVMDVAGDSIITEEYKLKKKINGYGFYEGGVEIGYIV